MYEHFNLYKNEFQKERIETIIAILERKNISWLNLDSNGLKKYFFVEDISVVQVIQANICMEQINKKIIKTDKKLHPKNFNKNQEFKFFWEEITPYTILGIEEKNYSKQELLKIASKKIKFLRDCNMDNKNQKEKIDEILDAYNELTKKYNKRK